MGFIDARNIGDMLKGMVKLDGWRCLRCGHEWLPRVKIIAPRTCPKCKSPYWNKPRKIKEVAQSDSQADKD